MEILVVFKNGEEIKKNVKQVFCNPKENDLTLIYGAFSRDEFPLDEISFYNIENGVQNE